MNKIKKPNRQGDEISIFQTKIQRSVSTKCQLLILLFSLVSSLFVVIAQAGDDDTVIIGFEQKCKRSKNNFLMEGQSNQ